MASGTHIRWTEDEERLLVETACDILNDKPFMTFISLLRAAMEKALFPDRIRNIQSITTVKWFKPRVERTMKERATLKDVKSGIRQQPVEADISTLTTETLCNELTKRLFFNQLTKWLDTSNIITRLSSEIVAGLRGSVAQKPVEIEVPKKTRVLIVGLLNEQRQQIQREWGEFFDLKFCEGNTPNLPDLARSCAVSVLMTKFTSHSQQESLKSVGAKILWCNGGVSDLERVLESAFNQL